MSDRKYYEAYDDRYKQAHSESLQWFAETPSEIVSQVMAEFGVSTDAKLLEIGCGEGRDARPLLKQGFNLLATDISPEAVSYCRKLSPEHADRFAVLDCIRDRLPEKYDFIFAVAVVHMLVLDEDRAGFYRFLHDQLADGGIALVCTMGDGDFERASDISTAFDLQERTHDETGRAMQIAGTSCRMVSWSTFEKELHENHLEILKKGTTAIDMMFNSLMYAVVRKES